MRSRTTHAVLLLGLGALLACLTAWRGPSAQPADEKPSGKRFAREIRGSGLKIIPKCGHVSPFECPDAFNEALLSFLAGPGR